MARKPIEIIRLIQLGFPCKITNDKHDINLTDWQRQSDNETKEKGIKKREIKKK